MSFTEILERKLHVFFSDLFTQTTVWWKFAAPVCGRRGGRTAICLQTLLGGRGLRLSISFILSWFSSNADKQTEILRWVTDRRVAEKDPTFYALSFVTEERRTASNIHILLRLWVIKIIWEKQTRRGVWMEEGWGRVFLGTQNPKLFSLLFRKLWESKLADPSSG